MQEEPEVSFYERQYDKDRFRMTTRASVRVLAAAVGLALAILGLVWNFSSPPLGSKTISSPPPPALSSNKPYESTYFGNGCFWHTQYDMFMVEQKGPSNRSSDTSITSLVGYGGGRYTSRGGAVCYHGNPSTDYSKLGYTEVVSVQLDGMPPSESYHHNTNTSGSALAVAQFTALCKLYFEHSFKSTSSGMQRLDPRDSGPEYRNAIGLPDGESRSASLFKLFLFSRSPIPGEPTITFGRLGLGWKSARYAAVHVWPVLLLLLYMYIR